MSKVSGHRKSSGVLCISWPPFACCARCATAFRQPFCIAYATRGPSRASNVHGLHGFLSRRNGTPVRAATAPTCARCALAPSPLPAAAPRRASALLVCTSYVIRGPKASACTMAGPGVAWLARSGPPRVPLARQTFPHCAQRGTSLRLGAPGVRAPCARCTCGGLSGALMRQPAQ